MNSSSYRRTRLRGTAPATSLTRSAGRITYFTLGALLPLTGFGATALGTYADTLLLPVSGVAALLVLTLPRQAEHGTLKSLFAVLAIAFVIVAGLVAFATDSDRGLALSVIISWIASTSVAALAVAHPRLLSALLAGFVAGAVILSASLVVLPNANGGRPVGLAGHPVEVGGILATAVAAASFWTTTSRTRLAVKICAIGAICYGMIVAQSATAIGAALIGIAVTGLAGRAFSARTLFGGLVLAGAILWIALQTLEGRELWDKFWTGTTQDPLGGVTSDTATTSQSRVQSVRAGIDSWQDAPIAGRGFGPNRSVVYEGLAPHNVIVLAAVVGGTLLAALYLALFACFVASIARLARHRATRRGHTQVAVAIAAASAAWAAAMTGPQLSQRWWLTIVAVGAFCAVGAFDHAKRSHADKTRVRAAQSR